ncbi:MAG: dTMP kinase [Candidatus Hadarchaeia archaeon]
MAIEGPDGCGKSTQTSLLGEWLESEGYETEVTQEPTKGPIGKIIRKSLKGDIELSVETEALLFASDRLEHVKKTIEPNLKKEKIVISERYVYSSLAYQTSRGLSKEWVEKINKYATKPDLTILIDIPPEIGARRMNSSRKLDTFDKDLKLQKRVREAYLKIAKEEGIDPIDGTKSRREVRDNIRKRVKKSYMLS